MEMDGHGGAEQAVNLCVGLRVPWKQVLKVLGRWHSQGNPALTSDRKHSGSDTKAYKCLYCDFHVKFGKRKSKQVGGADEAVCIHISEEHEPGCHATAQGGVVRVVREEVGEMLPTGEEPGVLGRAGMATDSRKRPAHLQTSQTARTKPFVQGVMYKGARTAPMDSLTHTYPTPQPSLTPSAFGALSALLSPPSHAAPGQYPSHHTHGNEPPFVYGPNPQQPWGLASHHGPAMLSSELGTSSTGPSHGLSWLTQKPSALGTLRALLSPSFHAAPGQYLSRHTQGQGSHSMYGAGPQQSWGLASHDGHAMLPSQLGPCTVASADETMKPLQQSPAMAAAISIYDLRRPPNHVHASKDDDMMYERYRGPGLGYLMRAVGVDLTQPNAEDSGMSAVVRARLVRGTGNVVIDHFEEKSFVDSVRLAISWAMLFEKCLAEAGFEIVHSLRSLTYDVQVNVTVSKVVGGSLGVVLALNLLQSMTNCFFNDEVMATGTIDLDGYVGLIGGVKAKVLCAGRVGGSKVFMLPELNLPDAQKHVQDRKLKLKLCPLISMSDAINGAVRKPKLRASLDTVVAEGAGAAALRHNLVTVKAIANEDSAFSIIAAVIPGSGKVHLTGVNPNPDRVREKLKGAIALEQALGWVREGDHRDGPHMHILDLLPAGACEGVMVDLINMRVTPLHPEASDYRPSGQPDAPIPDNSIDVHVHVRNDTYGLSADNAYFSSAAVLALVSLMTGLKPNSKVSVYGECFRDGRMHGDGYISPTSLRFIGRYYGVTTVLLSIRDVVVLKQVSPEAFQPTFDGPKVKPVAWIHECVREAFREPE